MFKNKNKLINQNSFPIKIDEITGWLDGRQRWATVDWITTRLLCPLFGRGPVLDWRGSVPRGRNGEILSSELTAV